MHFTEQMHITIVVNLVVCACILHNICLENNDLLSDEAFVAPTIDDEDGENTSLENEVQSDRRQQLIQELINAKKCLRSV